MKFFKNRAVAIMLAILVVAGSTLVNTQIRLTENCRQVEDGFYTSVSGSKSIYARLDARLDAANGLWTLLINHDAKTAATLNDARSSLLNACEARDISDMYDANKALQTAFDSAAAALSGYALSTSEADSLNDYATEFSGAQKMIDENGYNGDVMTFMRTVYFKFPAGILAPLVGVEAPEMFE